MKTLPQGFRLGAFFAQALPMIVSRGGLAAMAIADGIMVARYSPREFAGLSLADATIGRLLDVFIAVLMGSLMIAPRLFAAGDAAGAHALWKRTLPAALALGVLGIAASLFGRSVLTALGQPAELVDRAGPIIKTIGLGFPAGLLAISAAVYLEGINRPTIVAVAIVAANLLNLLLNYVFIAGHFGAPALGAEGSAISTTSVRVLLGITLLIVASRAGRSLPAGEVTADAAAERASARQSQWKIAFGTGVTVAAMVTLSASLTVFAGRLGVTELAVFAAAWGLAGPVMLIALGFADAAGVYVASESGRAGDHGAAAVAWASVRVSVAIIAVAGLTIACFAHVFAGVYAKDTAMADTLAALLPIVGMIVVIDCVGFVMSSCLRAIQEVAWPVAIDLASMAMLVPIAAGLAFGRGLGVRGLLLAMLAAGVVRAASLTLRFYCRTRHLAPQASPMSWSLDVE